MNDIDNLLNIVSNNTYNGAYNIRCNGKCMDRKETDNVKIINKDNEDGIDIIVNENTKNEIVHIPVIINKGNINEKVYNDFHINNNSNILLVSGCAIHNETNNSSMHNGIHRFYIGDNCDVKYEEKHYAIGKGKKEFNPNTIIYLGENSTLEMNTIQIKGVDNSIRNTKAILSNNSKLIINEKIYTNDNQMCKSVIDVSLNGYDSSVKVISRSVAIDNSIQEFESNIIGNNKCFGHVECDAIIKDNAKSSSTPKIVANNENAKLIHEASIGKIAGDQLTKLMTLGLTSKEAEEKIIEGFLN